jgi:hypothetical protein
MDGTGTARAGFGRQKIPGESQPPAVQVAPVQRSFLSNISVRFFNLVTNASEALPAGKGRRAFEWQ